jgi:Fur family zinc uptake transcriptional regulator
MPMTTPLPSVDHDHARCVDDALNRAAALCARRGARLTELRRRVLSAVKAYDVLDRLGRAAGSAKPPTVYRALDFLIAHGLVHRLESLNAYVGCPQPEASHSGRFLICDGCGDVTEFESRAIQDAIATRARELGFAIRDETVEARGLCQRCRTIAPGVA